jgi:hypothetical protein
MGLGKKFLATLALTGALSGAANTSVELHKYSEQSALPIPQLQVGTVANAGITAVQKKITDALKWFSWLGYAKAAVECGTQYYNNTGTCERNPKLVYKSWDEVLNSTQLPCPSGNSTVYLNYMDRSANLYASRNGLYYRFITPANKTFTFEKR